MIQNDTLEERVSLLEVQVADMREDITTIQSDVADLDQDVNFLFDEQVIQDTRLLQLETNSNQLNEEVEGEACIPKCFDVKTSSVGCGSLKSNKKNKRDISTADLQDTTLVLDFRVTTLENAGSEGNSSIAELEVKVEALEVTSADHETRLNMAESAVEGFKLLMLFNSSITYLYQNQRESNILLLAFFNIVGFLNSRTARNRHKL